MSLKFLKTGKATHESLAKAEAQTEAKKASGVFRFLMKDGAETQITFLDGDLDEGLLMASSYYEHFVKISGKPANFVCVAETEPCPLCEDGLSNAWVAIFTVIDHSKYETKDGKVIQHQIRPFICKRDTFKKLQKYANKHKGLAGVTFEVSRTGEKSPAVGSDFDFVEKQPLAAVAKKYGLKAEDVKPLDYEKVIKVFTAKQLRDLGFGAGTTPAVGMVDTKEVAKETNFETEL